MSEPIGPVRLAVEADPAQGPDVSHDAPGSAAGEQLDRCESVWPRSCMFDMLPRTRRPSASFAGTRTLCRIQGVVIAPRPDMIVRVIVECGAWHTPLGLGEPRNVRRAF